NLCVARRIPRDGCRRQRRAAYLHEISSVRVLRCHCVFPPCGHTASPVGAPRLLRQTASAVYTTCKWSGHYDFFVCYSTLFKARAKSFHPYKKSTSATLKDKTPPLERGGVGGYACHKTQLTEA